MAEFPNRAAAQELTMLKLVMCALVLEELGVAYPEGVGVTDPPAGQPRQTEANRGLAATGIACVRRPGWSDAERYRYALVAARQDALALLGMARALQAEAPELRSRIARLERALGSERVAAAREQSRQRLAEAGRSPDTDAREARLKALAAASAEPGPRTKPPQWPDCARPVGTRVRLTCEPADDYDGLRPGTPLDDALAYAACAERKREPAARSDARFRARLNQLQLEGYKDLPLNDYMGRSVRTHTALIVGRARQRPGRPGFDYGNDLFEGMLDQLDEVRVQWSFAAFGDQGRETVLAYKRAETFAPDRQPLASTLADAARQKWGAAHRTEEGIGAIAYRWAFDKRGEPLAGRAGSACEAPMYHTQHYPRLAQYRRDADAGCALALTVRIAKAQDQQRAHAFYVGVRNNEVASFEKLMGVLDIWANSQGEALRKAAPPPKF